MNSLAFLASSLNSTPRWLASTPTGYPCTRAEPVASEVPYSGLLFVEVGGVHDAGEDLARVERHLAFTIKNFQLRCFRHECVSSPLTVATPQRRGYITEGQQQPGQILRSKYQKLKFPSPRPVSALNCLAPEGCPMLRASFVVAVLFLSTLTAIGWAQSDASTASCNLDDGRQVYIRYNAVAAKNDKVPNGKPWTPGGTPMTLFTEAPLAFGA